MKPPTTVYIAPFEYQVRFIEGDRSLEPTRIGVCDKHEHEIAVCAGLNPQMTGNVLIHEMLHAVFYSMGIEIGDDNEEDLVNRLANGLQQVMRDNPEAVKYLMSLNRAPA